MPISIRDMAETFADFMPQFNDKLHSLFVPERREDRILTRSQVHVLMLLRKRSGQTATELGEALNMTKASLTGILDELDSKGLVRRTADAEDRRKSRLSLTGSGGKTADVIVRKLERALEARIAPLSGKDRDALARHLAATTAILEKL